MVGGSKIDLADEMLAVIVESGRRNSRIDRETGPLVYVISELDVDGRFLSVDCDVASGEVRSVTFSYFTFDSADFGCESLKQLVYSIVESGSVELSQPERRWFGRRRERATLHVSGYLPLGKDIPHSGQVRVVPKDLKERSELS